MEKEYKKLRKALLVIDIQEDYTGATAKSPFPYKDSERLITIVNKVIDDAHKENMTIVYIQQEFEGFFGKMISRIIGHGTAIKGKPGTEFDKRINIVSNHCFSKPMPDAFSNPEFEAFLAEQHISCWTRCSRMRLFYSKGSLKARIQGLYNQRWNCLTS